MEKDLTKSAIDRQNILNNNQVIELIKSKLNLTGFLFENEYVFTTKIVSEFYDVDVRTIKRAIENFEDEIKHNGYTVLKGQKLKEFKDLFGHLINQSEEDSQRDTNDTLSSQNNDNQSYKKIKNLALFNFRAFINIGMLLSESEKAKQIRSLILDIVIDFINKKIGGSTKYINQRDEEFLVAIAREPKYRKEFTSALNLYLEMGNSKYSKYTDEIYKAIFKENSKEYKQILQLEEKDNLRDTMYSEVLKLIASFEIGIADEMKDKSEDLGRKLNQEELDLLIQKFANKRLWIPQIEDARAKMASRDYGLRSIIHERLQNYIGSLNKDDYNRFLGERSKNLIDRLDENPELLDVFKRLKDR